MKETNLVSFIMISYNHASYLKDCMESVLNQTYENMEILYLDDASSDNSFEEAERYKERLQTKYKRVDFFQNRENQGIVKNLNSLIPLCQGEYVKILAADDFMLKNGIRDMVDCLNENSSLKMVYTNGVYGDENIHFADGILNKQLKQFYCETPPFGNDLFIRLYESDFIMAPAVMLRRDIYNEIGLYDEQFAAEDWDCFIRVALHGKIGYLNKCTVMYRYLSTSLSHSAAPKRRIGMKKNELLILEKYKDKVPGHGRDRMEKSYNEAVSDACHIANSEYMKFLRDYEKRNQLCMSRRNRAKLFLYRMGIFKLLGDKE